jgi:hypothetical protein
MNSHKKDILKFRNITQCYKLVIEIDMPTNGLSCNPRLGLKLFDRTSFTLTL